MVVSALNLRVVMMMGTGHVYLEPRWRHPGWCSSSSPSAALDDLCGRGHGAQRGALGSEMENRGSPSLSALTGVSETATETMKWV